MAEAEVVLSLHEVSKSFGVVKALKGMNLQVRRGTVHTLLGENGAGKSTLMKILAGVHPADSGEILLNGAAYAPSSPSQAAARGLAIVFQELSLSNNLSVAENIYSAHLPSRFGFVNNAQLYAQAEQLMRELGFAINVRVRVGDLSIAQRQMVEIAKGLSRDAQVVILDEPTSSLSDGEAEILFGLIARLKAAGKAVIYISHRMEEIMRLSDEITVMRDGEYVRTLKRAETGIDELIALMVGRQLSHIYPPPLHEPPGMDVPPLLQVRDLTHEGKMQGVSFEVRAGEILGFFGLVGAGRSDVMQALFGLLPASGEVIFEGRAVRIRRPSDAIACGIGFVTENRKEEGLVMQAPISSNISAASLAAVARGGWLSRTREQTTADFECRRLAVRTPSIFVPPSTLSGGNQQKVVLAKWLATKPKLLILDEPTRGVDVGAKFEIYKIIRQLTAEDTAILLVSSELPEVLGLADRVVVMAEKRVNTVVSAKALSPEQVMTYATGH